jgi:hypothetical protein
MLSRRSVLAAVLGGAVCAIPCAAQVYTTYDVVASNPVTGDYLGNTYEADLNNDGIHDLIVDTYYANGSPQPDFAVFIANGDGTFKSPVLYAYPSVFQGGPVAMTFGDFNGDGNIDMALAIGGTKRCADVHSAETMVSVCRVGLKVWMEAASPRLSMSFPRHGQSIFPMWSAARAKKYSRKCETNSQESP